MAIDKLTITKSLLGITDSTHDTELDTLLYVAKQRILNKAFPYDPDKTEVPTKYEYLQCRLAVEFYNKKGAEGESEHNENGINRKYNSVDDLLKEVVPVAGVFN